MALFGDEDSFSLADEKFDFDISLTPERSNGDDEDKVFCGAVWHKEQSISYSLEGSVKESVSSGPSLGEEHSQSPLMADMFEHISKEAFLLVDFLEGLRQEPESPTAPTVAVTPAAPHSPPAAPPPADPESFQEDSATKVSLFGKPADLPSPIKRETFCVQDTPTKLLPPALRRQLQGAGAPAGHGGAVGPGKALNPVGRAKGQPRPALRGWARPFGTATVLPSRPTAPGGTRTASSTRTGPADRLPLPSQVRTATGQRGSVGLSRSPSSRNPSRAASSESLLSDTASVTSDLSDSSLNTSLPGKRGLPAPSKVGMRRSSVGRVGLVPSRHVVGGRRNTSSSSSSVSSINSSLTTSPSAKANTSLNSSMSRLPGSSSVATRGRRSSLISSSSIGKVPNTPKPGRPSLSAGGRKGSEPVPMPIRSTPVKRHVPVPTPQNRTTGVRPLIRSASLTSGLPGTAQPVSAVKGRPKPKAVVAATPTCSRRDGSDVVVSSPDAPRMLKPKRLMSACSVESLAQKPVEPVGLQTPSAGGARSGQTKLRRPSALPTSVSRRMSGIPTMSPRGLFHPSRPQDGQNSPVSPRRPSSISPAPLRNLPQPPETSDPDPGAAQDPGHPTGPEPCSLPLSLEVQHEAELMETPEAQEPLVQPPPPPSNTVETLLLPIGQDPQLAKAKELNEVLLVDLPAPVFRPPEKLLIDLSNTPDLIRTATLKQHSEELIDLSSPLIKWSPEDKKENVGGAPLIDLSF